MIPFFGHERMPELAPLEFSTNFKKGKNIETKWTARRMKLNTIGGIILIAIGIGMFAYAQIVVDSLLPQYNYANYTGFRFPI